jgi:hypothetical protein
MTARLDAASPLHIRIVTVLMRQNLGELPTIVHLASGEGVTDVFVQYFCHDSEESSLPDGYRPMRDFIHAQALDGFPRAAIARAFEAARAAARDAGVTLRLPPLERVMRLRLVLARRVRQLSRRRHAVMRS